jgi:hypothetical protein
MMLAEEASAACGCVKHFIPFAEIGNGKSCLSSCHVRGISGISVFIATISYRLLQ